MSNLSEGEIISAYAMRWEIALVIGSPSQETFIALRQIIFSERGSVFRGVLIFIAEVIELFASEIKSHPKVVEEFPLNRHYQLCGPLRENILKNPNYAPMI